MLTYTAREAESFIAEILDHVQQAPVRIVEEGRILGVLVSTEDYESMRQFYANRLRSTLRESAGEAAEAGMTEEVLGELLANEDK